MEKHSNKHCVQCLIVIRGHVIWRPPWQSHLSTCLLSADIYSKFVWSGSTCLFSHFLFISHRRCRGSLNEQQTRQRLGRTRWPNMRGLCVSSSQVEKFACCSLVIAGWLIRNAGQIHVCQHTLWSCLWPTNMWTHCQHTSVHLCPLSYN